MTTRGDELDPYRAADRLEELVREVKRMASATLTGAIDAPSFRSKCHEAAAIVNTVMGPKHYIATQLIEIEVPTFRTLSRFNVPSPEDEFVGLVRAAINLMPLTEPPKGTLTFPDCDPDLWAHVEELVQIESWGKIPQHVVTFVEDWYRKRAGYPPHPSGARMHSADLLGKILADDSALALGGESSEQQGWMFLGRGLIQAIGNLHHHAIQQRDDAEQFAWGVIGLGSLLLGEMKRTHPERR